MITDSEEQTKSTKPLMTQFLRYLIVASIGYVVDFGSLIFFKQLIGWHYLLAATIGFLAGLIIVYFLSNRFVFGDSKIKSQAGEFGLFALIGLIGLVMLNLLMWLFTDIFLFNYLISKLIATVFVYIWNFFARRTLYHN